MEYNLTKNAKKLISLMYGLYLENRELGKNKSQSKHMGGSAVIKEKLLIDWEIADIDDTCRELSRTGLLKCFFAGPSIYNAWLTDAGIAYLESRFKNGLKDVVEFLSNLGAILPFPKNLL